MTALEVLQFETNPYLQEIIQVRLVDDGGKVANLKTHSFNHFEQLLQNLVDEHCTNPLWLLTRDC